MTMPRPALPALCLLPLTCLAPACRSPDPGGSTVKEAAAEVSRDDDGPFDPATADRIAALFQKIVDSRHPPGDTHVKRAVFLKPHGCAKAQFTIPAGLPAAYHQGLFATPGPHDAWVRISSDTVPQTSDLKNNTIGFSVKVLGVPGKKILAGEENAKTQDFLLQNHSVFFVDTAADFLAFTETVFTGTTDAWLAAHPRTDQILKDMAKPVASVLGSRYWSTMPYKFGDTDYAKYKVKPCKDPAAEPVPADGDKNYLKTRLDRDLKQDGACFELQVQLRRGGSMPLDQATVEWSEDISKPQTVATITIQPQDITGNDQICENMSFTAWHALPAHRPVGSVSKARGIVYKKLADSRRQRNGVPLTEPE